MGTGWRQPAWVTRPRFSLLIALSQRFWSRFILGFRYPLEARDGIARSRSLQIYYVYSPVAMLARPLNYWTQRRAKTCLRVGGCGASSPVGE